MMQRASVDLPEPDSPTTASVAPGGKDVSANSWKTLTYDLKGDPCESFMGNSTLDGNWGVMESLAVTKGDTSSSLTNTIYVDNFRVVPKTNYTVTVTVRVTDAGGLSDTRSFNVTVYTSPAEQAEAMSPPQSLAEASAVAPTAILNAVASSDKFSFSFGTEKGKTYEVEYTESRVKPKWLPLLTVFGAVVRSTVLPFPAR